MKRNYIIPATKVINVSLTSMMAISNHSIEKVEDGLQEGNLNDFEVLSRDDDQESSPNLWESEW